MRCAYDHAKLARATGDSRGRQLERWLPAASKRLSEERTGRGGVKDALGGENRQGGRGRVKSKLLWAGKKRL